MLARSGRLPTRGSWAYEVKCDGLICKRVNAHWGDHSPEHIDAGRTGRGY
jgi:hypothetical protein